MSTVTGDLKYTVNVGAGAVMVVKESKLRAIVKDYNSLLADHSTASEANLICSTISSNHSNLLRYRLLVSNGSVNTELRIVSPLRTVNVAHEDGDWYAVQIYPKLSIVILTDARGWRSLDLAKSISRGQTVVVEDDDDSSELTDAKKNKPAGQAVAKKKASKKSKKKPLAAKKKKAVAAKKKKAVGAKKKKAVAAKKKTGGEGELFGGTSSGLGLGAYNGTSSSESDSGEEEEEVVLKPTKVVKKNKALGTKRKATVAALLVPESEKKRKLCL